MGHYESELIRHEVLTGIESLNRQMAEVSKIAQVAGELESVFRVPPFVSNLANLGGAVSGLARFFNLAEALPNFAEIGAQFQQSLSIYDAALERKAELLGKLGWTVPMQATPREFVLLVDKVSDVQTADAAFLEYYKEDCGRSAELEGAVLNNAQLQRWNPVIEEALVNLKDARYRSCVALLLPLVEGVFAFKFSAPEFSRQTGRQRFFANKLLNTKPDRMDHWLWQSLKGFTEVLFQRVDFSDPSRAPNILNRHWLLHGRGIVQANLTDCLRILQALDTIVSLD